MVKRSKSLDESDFEMPNPKSHIWSDEQVESLLHLRLEKYAEDFLDSKDRKRAELAQTGNGCIGPEPTLWNVMVQDFEGRDGLAACDLGQMEHEVNEMASQSSFVIPATSDVRLSATPMSERRKDKVNISQAIVSMGESLKDGLLALATVEKPKEDLSQISLLEETNKTMAKLNESLEKFSDVITSLIGHINK
ncbi:hypothetical protein ROZALSC1DRAFT_24331 [Rozella allomycis CSF55]|uniref:Uncharacterized protein n=1 Tax=Rozella allomycis (strain CSF55) TaxID=988480 RepID=A0A4P9YFD4_ROZAC|nr:hypothetical protein ROZALSC1DRAFT_24331 [Rozella allomycis CSF55]